MLVSSLLCKTLVRLIAKSSGMGLGRIEEIVRISRVVTIHQFRLLPLRIRSLSLARSLHDVALMTPATPNQRLVLDTCDYVLLACEKEVLSM